MDQGRISVTMNAKTELERVRTEYPAGTACWFYDAQNEGSGKRGWIKQWKLNPSGEVVATMTSGEIIPLDHIMIDHYAK
jgi:hypothetical protein